MGTLTSWSPLGHSRPVTGLLHLYLSYIVPLPVVQSAEAIGIKKIITKT